MCPCFKTSCVIIIIGSVVCVALNVKFPATTANAAFSATGPKGSGAKGGAAKGSAVEAHLHSYLRRHLLYVQLHLD